ncbi:MAG: MFS transporter [Deltaproteobacteria bacterium]|jgi:MFS family permease|nr:MFS transporter [Deltaproteobacteria bacterium]
MQSSDRIQAPSRLFNKNYLLLWQGQTVSMLGVSLSMIALMLWIVETTDSATIMGSLLMVAAIPNIILGPLSGALADRYSRKKIIVVCDVVSGLLSLAMALTLVLYAKMPGLAISAIFVIYVGMAVTNIFFSSAVIAITPDLVPPDKVAAANALEMVLQQTAELFGRGFGAVLYRIFGGPFIFVLDGLTFLFSAVSESFITTIQKPPGGLGDWRKSLQQLYRDTIEGFAYVLDNRGLRSVIWVYGALNFFVEPFFVLMPFYVKDSRFLNASLDWVGYIFAGLALGTTIGYWLPAMLPKRGRTIGWLILVGMFCMGIGYGCLAVVHQAWIALLLMTANGILTGLNSNYIYSRLQICTPQEIRGRVLSVLTTLVLCVSPVGMGIAGLVADYSGHRLDVIFFICGGIMALVSLWGCLQNEFRRFIMGVDM